MAEHPSGPLFDPRVNNGGAPSSLHDSAFEPDSCFMFEDANDDEEFRNMQQNINSLHVLTEGNPAFHSSMGGGRSHNQSGMDDQYNPDFEDPFIFGEENISPHSPAWHNAPSTQAQIANHRNASVSHQYGQITPPSDTTPKDPAAAPPHLYNPSAASHSATSAKSERARNAANHRHAKAKKARHDSVRKIESPDDDEEDEVEDKRERYREKNRVAAAKCRAKKKVNTVDLEESARDATALNTKLRAEERELRDLFSSLRNQALAHDPSQGCGCQSIHTYNMHKAQQTARGAMGLHGLMIPSPTQRSIDSASPSTAAASSRAPSFSGMRPQFAQYPARSQSQASGMGYMPNEMPSMPQGMVGDGDGFPEFVDTSGDNRQSNYS